MTDRAQVAALEEARSFVSDARTSAAVRGAEGAVERADETLALIDAALEPPLYTRAWVNERARRGLRALEDSEVEIVREVLEALADFPEAPDA